jgi:hypothetical protein
VDIVAFDGLLEQPCPASMEGIGSGSERKSLEYYLWTFKGHLITSITDAARQNGRAAHRSPVSVPVEQFPGEPLSPHGDC